MRSENNGEFNKPAPDALDLLLTRRSGSAKAMTGPGPSPAELNKILEAAARAPDHGKLFPWRFIVFEGDARNAMGELLIEAMNEGSSEGKHAHIERERFLRAPVVVAVVSRITENHKIPEWEQILSAGAVCQNMLVAIHALGYTGNWVTEWYAYDARVKDKLGLKPSEHIAGFIYIGQPAEKLEERPRPDMTKIVSRFSR
jgi:nitroreductase